VAQQAGRFEQTDELVKMLRQAHFGLAASNESLRKECDALRAQHSMDADQWRVRAPPARLAEVVASASS